MSAGDSDLVVTVNDGVKIIKFNRSSKKNAINLEMYTEITNMLNNDARNDDIVVTIFTGSGDYFSSGNDLSIALSSPEELRQSCYIFHDFVKALIDYPKLIIAVVNGPAIGVAVTALALMDVVYVSDRATFLTPFVRLGICPEACSSYLLPRIMGRSRAFELLLLGYKMTAEDAYAANFVSKVIPHEQLPEFIKSLHKYNTLSVQSVKMCKKLIDDPLRKDLHAINDIETAELIKCAIGEHEQEPKRSKSKL